MRSPKGRLELTWMGKDMAPIPTAQGKHDYEWVDPADPRRCDIRRPVSFRNRFATELGARWRRTSICRPTLASPTLSNEIRA